MNESGIIKFLSELDIDQDSVTRREGWVNSVCPLAPWMHGSGEDRHPSFGISITDNGASYYYCFGCTPYGRRLDALIHNLYVATGVYPADLARVFAQNEVWEVDPDKVEESQAWQNEPVVVDSLPGEVLKQYPKLWHREDFEARRCRAFLRQRGIPVWVQEYFGVRYARDWSSLVFPLTNRQGHVYLLRMRHRKAKKIMTVSPGIAGFPDMKFPRLKHSGVWFGMHQVDWRKPIILVEGEIDAMRLVSLGWFNVMASTTSSVTDSQLSKLVGKSVILGYDADAAGRHAHRRIVDYLPDNTLIKMLDWSLAEKPDGSPCKDAGDLKNVDELKKVLDKRVILC